MSENIPKPEISPIDQALLDSRAAIQNPLETAMVHVDSGTVEGAKDVNAHKANYVINAERRAQGIEEPVSIGTTGKVRTDTENRIIKNKAREYDERFKRPGDYSAEQVFLEAGKVARDMRAAATTK